MAFRRLHSQWFRIANCAAESSFRNCLIPSYMHHCSQMHTRCLTYCPVVKFAPDVEEKSAVSSKKVVKNWSELAREAKFFLEGSTRTAEFEGNIHKLLRKVVSSYRKEGGLDVRELSRCFFDSPELVGVLPSMFISAFIKVLAEKKMLEDAVGVFVQARENRVEPHINSCNFLLKCLMEGKKGKVFMDVFNQLRNSGPPPNVHTYTILLNSYRSEDFLHKADLVRAIDEVLREMVSLGLTPSVVTNNTVVCALCEAGYVELALDYVRKSRNTAPRDFNVYCYSPIIRGLCHTGKVDEALELLEEMKRCSVSPDASSYGILIHGLCQKGDINNYFRFWKDMNVWQIKPDTVTSKNFTEKSGLVDDRTFYNRLIEHSTVTGYLRTANHLLQEMTMKGLNPYPFTFNELIQAFYKDGRFEEGLQVFNTMQKAHVAPDIFTCNAVVEMYCRERRLVEALKVMNEMQNRGIVLDSCTYHILIKLLCNKGMPEKAWEVLPVMFKKAVFLEVDHYNILIKAFSNQLKPNVALMLYKKMLRVGLKPNVRTYTVIFNCIKKMVEKGITPYRILYDCVIVWFCNIGDLETAFDVYRQMLRIGHTPDGYTFTALIDGFCGINRTDIACSLLEDMDRKKCVPNAETYNIVIAACRKDGNHVVADKLVANMRRDGIHL
ncbi:Pentatricopeptide repeat-containing protein At1g62670, mitochondrial [Linum grandiflorum]